MLEEVEMKFILTDADGKLLGCYTEIESAEMDAKDMVDGKDEGYTLSIYELINAQKLGDPILQNTYELRKSLPEPEPEEDSAEEAEGEGDKKEEGSEPEEKKE
jgi:hypothetical protein